MSRRTIQILVGLCFLVIGGTLLVFEVFGSGAPRSLTEFSGVLLCLVGLTYVAGDER